MGGALVHPDCDQPDRHPGLVPIYGCAALLAPLAVVLKLKPVPVAARGGCTLAAKTTPLPDPHS